MKRKSTQIETKDFLVTIIEGHELQISVTEKTKNMYTYSRYKKIGGVKEFEMNFSVKSDDELAKMGISKEWPPKHIIRVDSHD